MSAVRWVSSVALLATLGCRPGVGDNCVCEGECRGGLVCARGGQILEPGMCVSATGSSPEPGRCIESENLPDGDGGSSGGPPMVFDVGGKRDFEGPISSTMDDGVDPTQASSEGSTTTPTSESSSSGGASAGSSSSSGSDGSSSGSTGSSTGSESSSGSDGTSGSSGSSGSSSSGAT